MWWIGVLVLLTSVHAHRVEDTLHVNSQAFVTGGIAVRNHDLYPAFRLRIGGYNSRVYATNPADTRFVSWSGQYVRIIVSQYDHLNYTINVPRTDNYRAVYPIFKNDQIGILNFRVDGVVVATHDGYVAGLEQTDNIASVDLGELTQGTHAFDLEIRETSGTGYQYWMMLPTISFVLC